MADQDFPQIYLICPPAPELSQFPTQLAQVLDAHPVACLRLAPSTKDESTIARLADAIREVAHARDVALVLADYVPLVEKLGLDGVHLGGHAPVRDARDVLGADAIVGTYCGASRHSGMEAGEAGADYISFGPSIDDPLTGGSAAPMDLFQWWSEMVEVPVVAEGALSHERVRALAPYTDFFGLGPEIWDTADPVATLGQFIDNTR